MKATPNLAYSNGSSNDAGNSPERKLQIIIWFCDAANFAEHSLCDCGNFVAIVCTNCHKLPQNR
jgi:hypothetical protein